MLRCRLRHLLVLVCALSCASAAAIAQPVITGPLVVSERWPQCTDLATWTRDVMRLEGVENASETIQARAFFRWLRLFNRMATGGMIQAFEGPHGKEEYVLDAHKHLFVYGWGYCDTTSRIAEAAWKQYKQTNEGAERVITQHDDGGYHTMYRLRLDGNWGAFDPRYGYFLIERDAPDARILDWAEVGVDENIRRNKTYKHRSKPFFEFFGPEWKRAFLINECWYPSEERWVAAGRPVECVFGNSQYEMDTPYHDMQFRLPKGTTIERFWDNSARKFYVPASPRAAREEPFQPSGRFYRVTETMLDGNWPKQDPNYEKAKPYLVIVPKGEGYNDQVSGGRTIGQAWGRLTYEPDWAKRETLQILTPESNLAHAAQAPFLRAADNTGGAATLDFYSPYILVDGVLEGELLGRADEARIEIRAQLPKPRQRDQPDVWSDWEPLHSGGGQPFAVDLGRDRFNGRQVSLHGVYRFQVRVRLSPKAGRMNQVGLKALRLRAHFENGIMSLPQIFAGDNTIHFKVADATAVTGPIQVRYRFQTADGEKAHAQTIRPEDFRGNVASYTLRAPGLTRCNSVEVAY